MPANEGLVTEHPLESGDAGEEDDHHEEQVRARQPGQPTERDERSTRRPKGAAALRPHLQVRGERRSEEHPNKHDPRSDALRRWGGRVDAVVTSGRRLAL